MAHCSHEVLHKSDLPPGSGVGVKPGVHDLHGGGKAYVDAEGGPGGPDVDLIRAQFLTTAKVPTACDFKGVHQHLSMLEGYQNKMEQYYQDEFQVGSTPTSVHAGGVPAKILGDYGTVLPG